MSELGIDIFKKGSTTYYYSSKFFPKHILKDVTKLYAFVRKADDFVDSIPQKKKEFFDFKKQFEDGVKGKKIKSEVVKNFLELFKRKKFEKKWVDAFFNSMEMDLKKNNYKDMKELDEYLFGSSEVVGLMMVKILNLPKKSEVAAKNLGKGMQYINFIRDLEEDLHLNRQYFPQSDFKECDIKSLEYKDNIKEPNKFCNCIRKQIIRYFDFVKKGEDGFKHIPYRYLVPIKTATDMYAWTAIKIFNDPFIIYQEKVKPPKIVIIWYGLVNLIFPFRKLKYLDKKDLEKVKSCCCK